MDFGIVIKITQFLLSLSLLIILHELGHFIPAKLFKTKVEKFFLFFDPWFALFKKKIGDTEYGIGWLPFGGYVKISGMVDESMDKEQLKAPPKPWEFRSKPAWQRLIIMIGGVTVNFFLAVFIFSALLMTYGEAEIPIKNIKYGLQADSISARLGLVDGDVILSVDNKPTTTLSETRMQVLLGNEMVVERNNKDTLRLRLSSEVKEGLNSPKVSFLNPRIPAVIGQVLDGTAKKAGLLPKDEILALNNAPLAFWHEFSEIIQKHKNDTVTLSIGRNGQMQEISVWVPQEGKIGINQDISYLKSIAVYKTYSIGAALAKGFQKTIDSVVKQIEGIKYISGQKNWQKQLSGPIGIAQHFPDHWDWMFFWTITAVLSAWLAFLNILPIPALDGGHVVFVLWEMITGKAPSQKVLEIAQMVGVILLLSLMVFILGNDIFKLFGF